MEYQVEKISKQIKFEKTINKIFKFIILAFLSILLIINLVMLYQTNIRKQEIPSIFGISVFNIVSGSMEPTININDLIVIKKSRLAQIKVGDIITFKDSKGTIITHEIINIKKEAKKTFYTTKGKNNQEPDSEPVKYDQIYGKYLFKIKGVGKLAETLQKNNGLISVALLIIIFIILKNSKDKKRETRKRLREKYDIKKKRDEYNKK